MLKHNTITYFKELLENNTRYFLLFFKCTINLID